MKQQSACSEGPYPPLTNFMAGEREVNGGRKQRGVREANARMKVFIGFQRVADMSTLGSMIDRKERWTGRKSISISTYSSTGFRAYRAFRKYSVACFLVGNDSASIPAFAPRRLPGGFLKKRLILE